MQTSPIHLRYDSKYRSIIRVDYEDIIIEIGLLWTSPINSIMPKEMDQLNPNI